MSWSGIKSIVTFYQEEEPESPEKGDIWYKPSRSATHIWSNNWIHVRGPGFIGGFIAGGWDINGTIIYSTIEKIDFSSDSTSSSVGNLSVSRGAVSGCNSSNYGFIICGRDDGSNYLSNIERINFHFNLSSISFVGNLNTSMMSHSSCNSSTHGFTMGGHDGTTRISHIEKIIFPHDSGTSVIKGNLTDGLYYCSGFNSSTHGFSSNGLNVTSDSTAIHRILFPFDSGDASYVGDTQNYRSMSSTCNSSNHGYIMGGYTGYGQTSQSFIQRIEFPFDSGTASIVGNLSGSRQNASGINSSIYGYNLCGSDQTTTISIIDRFEFPFDSGIASVIGNLSYDRSSAAGVDNTDFVT